MAKIDILKNSSKVSEDAKIELSSNLQEMSSTLHTICIKLTVPSNNFKPKETFGDIKDYVNKYDRLLYANISSFCFSMESEQRDNFQGNIEKLVEYVYSWDFENGIKSLDAQKNSTEVNLRRNTKRVVLKMYDHINLAAAQLSSLKRSDDELQSAVMKKLSSFRDDITKDMSSQLITLVGIFTAIAFLVFGGFSALTSALENFYSTPIPKIVFLISLWGLVICNGVFIFLTAIEKITLKEKKSSINSVFQWTNLILLTVAALSIWIYFVDRKNIGAWSVDLLAKVPNVISVGGFVLILLFFIIGMIFINSKKTLTIKPTKSKDKKN